MQEGSGEDLACSKPQNVNAETCAQSNPPCYPSQMLSHHSRGTTSMIGVQASWGL